MLQPAQFSQAIEESSRRIGRPRLHLGVLLVHGLGEQVRGETLTVQGDPLVQWLRKHVGAGGSPGDPKVDVLDVVARQASSDTIPNAHAIVRITPPVDPETGKTVQPPAFWIIAEAFWAENFRQATFLEFIGWGLSIGPWVWATHVAGIRRRIEIGKDVDNRLRLFLVPITWVLGGVLLLIAAAVSFVTTVLAVVVILVAFTRIPLVADAARSFQRTLANGFGDAFVLSRSPIRFGAMAAEVRAALQVLRTHCDVVAVIAESQGTAVAWYGLKHEMVDAPGADEPSAAEARDGEEPRPKAPIGLFLTHAQGLRKLAFALTIARKPPKERARLAAIESTAFLGLAVLALLVNAPWYLALAAVLLALIAEISLLLVATPIWNEAGNDIAKDWVEVLKSEAKANAEASPGGPQLEWLDLWASADPGPVGPLDVKGKRVRSYKIRNVGSLWADHVYYWRNTTEFLPIVASYLFTLGGPGMYAKGLDDPRLLVPAMRRHARVVALLPFRALVVVGVAVGLLYALRSPDLGSGLIDFVAPLNLPVVVRINSPGGSAMASDVIWREVILAKKVKPVIASMSDVAASGGYYMAMACDTIVAHPNTITGSIGVFGMFANLEEFLDNKLGVTVDRVKTGRYSDMPSVTRQLTDVEKQIIQESVDRIYADFTTKAAQGRKMPVEQLRKFASGRVWSGIEAKERGLVDAFGDLDDAVKIAAARAGIKDEYRLKHLPVKKTFFTEFMSGMETRLQTHYLKNELGDMYGQYQKVKELRNLQGIQARLPYDLMIQ